MDYYEMTDKGILAELGKRARQKRLSINMSQQELAKKSGLSRRSVYLMESGHPIGIKIFIGVLRALKSLDELDSFLPETDLSPLQLAKLKGKVRKHASRPRSKEQA